MYKSLINSVIVELLVIFPIVLSKSSLYNIIETRSNDSSINNKYCIIDFIYDNNSTHYQKRDEFYLFENLSGDESQFCGQSGHPLDKNVTNKFVIINYSKDCDINEQINYFNEYKINGLLISVSCDIDIENNNITDSTLFNNKFSVSLIMDSSVSSLLSFGSKTLKLYAIKSYTRFDFSIIVIWFLATFTIVLGSYWSGFIRFKLFQSNYCPSNQLSSTIEVNDSSAKSKSEEEEAFIKISPIYVLVFVVMMSLLLLGLYFFYRYLIYVIISIFVLASMVSVFFCMEVIAMKLLPNRITVLSFTLPKFGKLYFYQLVLIVVAMSLSITWFIIRKESYSWIFQDILGISFSLNLLRTIRLPSYKICAILLSLLFIYDIFFVFITPLITSSGNSVMVDVATGGSTKSRCGTPGEMLPLLLRVPHMLFKSDSSDPIDVCFPNRDSLLGFGDILVPGLLVSYCYAFDLIVGVKYRIYYITNCICYGLGLIATFAGLYLMNGVAQPALLYLVPLTLIPPLLIAIYRKELKLFWSGPEAEQNSKLKSLKQTNSTEDVNREDNQLINSSRSSGPTNSL